MTDEQNLTVAVAPGSDVDELTRLKFQFLASLNHEIRTPLTGIMGMTDLLLETDMSEEQKDYVTAAKVCAESLFEILNATLEFTALSAGNLVLDHSEFAPREVLRNAAEEYRYQSEDKGLILRVIIDPSLPELAFGDALRLRQLVGYLVSNAVKFTHVGSVTVEAAAEEQENGLSLVIDVSDSGIGIEPQALETIFESFQQLESGLSRNYTGLGLGLALTQKLVSLMGGTIVAESTKGQGSHFSLRIPLTAISESTSSPRPARTPQSLYHLLVVEDNKVARDIVEHVLLRRPYQIDFADCGEAAVDAACQRRYDLVLMDLQMPGMDGIEATAAIRQIQDYDDVPVLAFTASASDEYRNICRLHGMQGFVAKPIQADDMLRTLDTFLPA